MSDDKPRTVDNKSLVAEMKELMVKPEIANLPDEERVLKVMTAMNLVMRSCPREEACPGVTCSKCAGFGFVWVKGSRD